MKIGIIGAGTMGAGITQAFAAVEGYEVVLCDRNEALAVSGKEKIRVNLEKLTKKGKITCDNAEKALAKIQTGVKENLCFDCDLVIEAALEVMDIKKKTFEELDKICKPQCIFASNTSSMSVTKIGIGLSRPVAGMHFFNPAPVMKLVEVIVGHDMTEELQRELVRISRDIGKTPILVKEAAGFVVNRLLVPMINEAVGIYADGTASAEDIDTAMQLGANHPTGPLTLGDMIGLDIILAVMEVIQRETKDTKYRPHPLLKEMVSDNKLGVKTKEGFYKYK